MPDLIVSPPPQISLQIQPPNTVQVVLEAGQGPAGPGLVHTFETYSKNLRSADFDLTWVDGVLTTVEYADGKWKSFQYNMSGDLESITLYDEFDVVIAVKTFSHVDGLLRNVSYT